MSDSIKNLSLKTIIDSNIPELIIEEIGIEAPIILNVDGTNKTKYLESLRDGVAHYQGTSLPGENNNIFIFGHSSSFEKNKYNKVFSRLNELNSDDLIEIIFNDKLYTYQVFDKSVVNKEDQSVLDKTDQEQLTLMTCWPIGTNFKRLVIKSHLVKTSPYLE